MASARRASARSAICRSRTSGSSSAWTSTSRSTDGKITDDSRIREALPTIKHALERGRARHLREPPRPAEEGARPEALARAVRRCAWRSSSGRTCTLPGGLRRRRGQEGGLRPSRAGRCACSRTSASTRKKRRTTRASAEQLAELARRLRRRRVRRRAPRARERARRWRSSIRDARLRLPPREGDRRARARS